MARRLDDLADLRELVHDALGQLMTACYAYGFDDEAQHWQVEYQRAMRIFDMMINQAIAPPQPRPGRAATNVDLDQDVGEVKGGNVSGVTVNVWNKDKDKDE